MFHVIKIKSRTFIMTSAIVILNWNDWKNTVDCLESIYQNEGNFDVFLIDNGSSLNNLLKISNWYKGNLISDRKFIKPRLKNQGELKFINLKDNIFNEKNTRNLYLFRNKTNLGLTAGLNQAYKFLIRNKYEYILRIDNDFVITRDYFKKL